MFMNYVMKGNIDRENSIIITKSKLNEPSLKYDKFIKNRSLSHGTTY